MCIARQARAEALDSVRQSLEEVRREQADARRELMGVERVQ